jgi:hypothetical protein
MCSPGEETRHNLATSLAFNSPSTQNRAMKNIHTLYYAASILLLALGVRADSDYPPDIKPIVEGRCMVCHGCYDAPCQLKLDALAGLQRGAPPTRLFKDAQTIEAWRQMGFYPVMDEASPEQGVMARMLALKQEHPLPDSGTLPESITLGLGREQQCTKPEVFDQFARDYPLWGMPYGLPGLDDEEHQTLTDWLDQGAPGVPKEPPSPGLADTVQRWEAFFNGDSLKERLMARYMYEHLFIGNLYFADHRQNDRYFNLVRSRTPPGEPIDIIATRRPYDDPGEATYYYRLQPLPTAVLTKRHMPYALTDERMARWRALFLDADYEVTALPSYEFSNAANPFVTFRELPEEARYRFMLEEAQFTIMGFIKGPVCRGQVALNVIDDHFWVVFLNPDRPTARESAEFLASASGNLRLPADRKRGAVISMIEWRNYSKSQLKFLKEKFEHIQAWTGTDGIKLDLEFIWDGDGDNDNAALTVFRHSDSASVVKGFVGQQPNTAWVIDYSLLERIHYLLVAGFDVFGNVAHQLESRLYMDFLRMEGEQNFLFFLPPEQRLLLRDFWYREATREASRFVMTDSVAFDRTSGIEYKTGNPKREFLDMLRERIPATNASRYQPVDPRFERLQSLQGTPFSHMPEVTFLEVTKGSASQFYTILHNNSFTNNAQIFREAQRRVPQEDYLTVVQGFIGAYPNAFFKVPDEQLAGFVKAIELMGSEADYSRLVTDYGVRRTDDRFWPMSDRLHAHYREAYPREAGLFDLNRYENR